MRKPHVRRPELKARQVGLIRHHQIPALAARAHHQRLICSGPRSRSIHNDQGQIRIGHRLIASFDAKLFHQFAAFANTRGISQCYGNAGKLGDFRNQIAGSAGNFRDNGPIFPRSC